MPEVELLRRDLPKEVVDVLAAIQDAACILDSRGNLVATNDAVKNLYQKEDEVDLLGRNILDYLNERGMVYTASKIREVLESMEPASFEEETASRYYQHSLRPLGRRRDKGALLVFITRDITEQLRQDIELRREQQRQIFYMESLPGYVMLLDGDFNVRYTNRVYRQLFGKVRSLPCYQALKNGDEPCSVCPPMETFTNNEPRQWIWKHENGRSYQAYSLPMTDVDLSPVVMVMGIDITARLEAEDALLQAQEHQRAILDNIPDLVWLKDERGRFVAVNHAYAVACGKDPDMLRGGNEWDAWSMEQANRLSTKDKKAMVTGTKEIDEELFVDATGEEHWMETVRVPFHGEDGRVLGLTGIARDITERKHVEDALRYSHAEMERHVQHRTSELRQAVNRLEREIEEHRRTEEELKKARERAEVATRAKSVFLANMSHEIRTPLNIILTMTDMALAGDAEIKQERALQMVREAGGSLLHVINDILDFSKIEARKLTLENVDFNLGSLLEIVWDIHALNGRQKGLDMKLVLDSKLSSPVKGDPARIRQVLSNLLANAVKFTSGGNVTLRADLIRSPRDKMPGQACITVNDSGIGIQEDKIDLIFKSFQQADDTVTRKFGGTGLGLSISKRLVELMGRQACCGESSW